MNHHEFAKPSFLKDVRPYILLPHMYAIVTTAEGESGILEGVGGIQAKGSAKYYDKGITAIGNRYTLESEEAFNKAKAALEEAKKFKSEPSSSLAF